MAGFANFSIRRNNKKNLNTFEKSNMFSKDSGLNKSERIMNGIALWASFYRANPHRFAKDYLDVNLKLFQQIIIHMMDKCNFFMYLASRGQSKTFLTAIYCCIRCILYPGTQIRIAAGSKKQSQEVIEKIINILKPNSANLAREIKDYSTSINNIYIEFHNASMCKVVAANDQSRGNRSNIVIFDEFRMIKLDIVNKVLRKFNTNPRHPKYLDKPEYVHLQERNKEIYLSSAYFKTHWSWNKAKAFFNAFLNDKKKYFICGLPYQLSVREGLEMKEAIMDEMSESDFDAISWSMEKECLFFGESENAFFAFDQLDNNRKIRLPIYPRPFYMMLGDIKHLKYEHKKNGEIRFIAADIATMAGNKNDASAYMIFQLLPLGNNQYLRNVVYMESMTGGHTVDQSIRIRQLYDDFDCDYIVLDTLNAGIGIFDNLVQDIVDEDRNVIYKAFTCMNDTKMAERCKSFDAQPVIYSIKGNSGFNSECAVTLRDALKRGKVRLLLNESDGRDFLMSVKQFHQLPIEHQAMFEAPYHQVSALVKEMVNLDYETVNGVVKVKEAKNIRKDRYSALSYGNYFANILESDLRVCVSDYEYVALYN